MFTSSGAEPGSVSGSYPLPDRGPRRTVVVAADDDELRERLRQELAHDGYRVIEADDGAEVMDYLALSAQFHLPAPDLIVAEVQMSGVDGLTLFGLVRRLGHLTPFILLSPKNDRAAYELAVRLDAELVFEEPVRCDEVCEAVASLVG